MVTTLNPSSRAAGESPFVVGDSTEFVPCVEGVPCSMTVLAAIWVVSRRDLGGLVTNRWVASRVNSALCLGALLDWPGWHARLGIADKS